MSDRAVLRRPRRPEVQALLDHKKRIRDLELSDPVANTAIEGAMTAAGADGATHGSMDESGQVNATVLNAESVTLNGESLDAPGGILWGLPQGIMDGSMAYRNISGHRTTDLEWGFLEMSAEVRADRTYRINVEPWVAWNEPNATSYMRLRYTWGETVPTVDDAVLEAQPGRMSTTAESSLVSFGGSFLLRPDETGRINILISIGSDTGVRIPGSPNGEVTAWMEDVGPIMHQGGRDRHSQRRADGGTEPPDETAPVRVKRRATWSPSAFRTYTGTGDTYLWPGQTDRYLFQGLSPAGYGKLSSVATFGNNWSFIQGAEILRARVQFKVSTTYAYSGGTAQVMLHGQTSPPASKPNVAFVLNEPVKAGETVTAELPSSVYAAIAAGTYRGLGFGITASADGYGYYVSIEADSIRWIIDYLK